MSSGCPLRGPSPCYGEGVHHGRAQPRGAARQEPWQQSPSPARTPAWAEDTGSAEEKRGSARSTVASEQSLTPRVATFPVQTPIVRRIPVGGGQGSALTAQAAPRLAARKSERG